MSNTHCYADSERQSNKVLRFTKIEYIFYRFYEKKSFYETLKHRKILFQVHVCIEFVYLKRKREQNNSNNKIPKKLIHRIIT